jgi:transposase-like protein
MGVLRFHGGIKWYELYRAVDATGATLAHALLAARAPVILSTNPSYRR